MDTKPSNLKKALETSPGVRKSFKRKRRGTREKGDFFPIPKFLLKEMKLK